MKTRSFFILSLFVLVSFWSCEQEEGCLDPRAVNFDVSADKECCCTFPTHNIRLYPTLGDITYNPDSVIIDNGSTNYQINDYRMYLSDIRLVRANNEEVNIIDTLDVNIPEVGGGFRMETLIDDYLLIEPNVLAYEVGEIITEGSFEKLRFYVGLDASANDLKPDDFEDNHALAAQNPSMYQNDTLGYNFFSTKIVIATDTIDYTIFGDDFRRLVEVDIPGEVYPYTNFELRLEMDLEALFLNVDFLSDSKSIIKEKIADNFDEIFTMYVE